MAYSGVGNWEEIIRSVTDIELFSSSGYLNALATAAG